MQTRVTTVLLFATLAAGPAAAHERVPERGAFCQIDDTGAVCLWRAKLDSNAVPLMRRAADQNGDGRLDSAEAQRVASRLLRAAMTDVAVRWDKLPAKWRAVEARLEAGHQHGALIAVGLVSLDARIEPGSHRLEVTVEGREALGVGVQGLEGWRVTATSSGKVAADGAGLHAPVTLTRGQSLAVTVER